MRATEDLVAEHGGVLRMLAILEEVAARLEAGRRVPAEQLNAMVEFLQVFADRCHHAKEEGVLFPAMEAAGIPRQGGPLGVMFAEHVTARAHVRALADSAAGAARGDRAAAATFAEHARAYAALLRAHIDKEDHVLYPMADRVLNEKKQDALAEEFEQIERDVIGPGRHEAFHHLLDELEAEYLGKAAPAHAH